MFACLLVYVQRTIPDYVAGRWLRVDIFQKSFDVIRDISTDRKIEKQLHRYGVNDRTKYFN